MIKTKAQEQKRVDTVAKIIDEQLVETQTKIDDAKKRTKEIETTYGANTRVNTLEVDDQMETNASVQQQKQLISMALENETVLNHKDRQLKSLQGSPYFGKIELTEDGQDQTFYIGTSTLQDNNNDFLIHDWRAPISSLYYNGTLGKVKYELPKETKEVELTLKRQFNIVDNKIKNMFDTNETVGDEILQNALGSKSSEYMKNIVATIQQEQNTIIRDTTSDVLIVQGAAGSGKTSAILQRVAYLLYHSRSQLNSDNMILFSPNKLFSNYISQVLPSLGENNMRQVTLDDFLSRRLYGVKVQSLFERFEKDLHSLPETTKEIRNHKESKSFFLDVKQYFSDNNLKLNFEDIYFEDEIFFSHEHIQSIFDSLNTRLPIGTRYLQTKNQLIKELKKRIKLDAMDEWVQDEIDNLDDLTFQQLLKDNQIEDSEKQREFLSQKFLKERYRTIYNGIFNDFYWNPYKAYASFLEANQPNSISSTAWKMMIDNLNDNIEAHKIDLSDAILVLLIRDLITQTGTNYSIQQIFVDEMQDYPTSVFEYLKFAFPNSKFTLLGDFSQDIFASTYVENNRLDSLQDIFSDKKCQLITLNQSYRSTADITDFAKAILPHGQKIKTFSRSGNLVQLKQFVDEDTYIQSLPELYHELTNQNDTVAILTTSNVRAKYLYDQLKEHIDVSLISDQNRKLKSGLLILPIYLAKGLEFDAVIADNINQDFKENQLDILYTIFTRAMHDLIVTSVGDFSPVLDKIDSKLYKKS
ncbi:RNA polymerase recycling motor HelD [Lactobacillus sp. YT155]|uniref:RNA polymerase recycling motor HelD n=1 Tax=Lactobacillus sp. YT155 TaxID=3060955 RepID=UPI00265F3110|nr:RNA polymerase recycling motor HelD [Lactobacillus sp. YT155]MDO1604640.1 RNA polymerase recycling motor HelD [Lactobacillus sp. YT155]